MTAQPPTITDGTVTLTYGAAGQYYGYCTIADVKFEFANFTQYTTLSNSVMGQEISYAAQEFQDQLEDAYVMPYAGTNQGILTLLRQVNAALAVARIVDRYMQGEEPNVSAWAAARRTFAETLVRDVIDGAIRWDTPFGDATPRALLPVYDRATGATIIPSPTAGDDSATPIFTIGRLHYRRGGQL